MNRTCRASVLFVAWSLSLLVSAAAAQLDDEPSVDGTRRHVLMIFGLPGDSDHAKQFGNLARSLRREFQRLGVERIVELHASADHAPDETPYTSESLRSAIRDLMASLTASDGLWIVFVGHADYDGEHARFHIPGSDLTAVDYADLLDTCPCREQVIWLTMSSSGWFTEPLSKPGRVIITATRPEAEPNETEFPHALAHVLSRSAEDLNADKDGRVVLLELFAAVQQEVERRYASDDRAPTEHATLDDNGDGRGSEWKEISAAIERMDKLSDNATELDSAQAEDVSRGVNMASTRADGKLAAKINVSFPWSSAQADEDRAFAAETDDLGMED